MEEKALQREKQQNYSPEKNLTCVLSPAEIQQLVSLLALVLVGREVLNPVCIGDVCLAQFFCVNKLAYWIIVFSLFSSRFFQMSHSDICVLAVFPNWLILFLVVFEKKSVVFEESSVGGHGFFSTLLPFHPCLEKGSLPSPGYTQCIM